MRVSVSYELLIEMITHGYKTTGIIETVSGIPREAIFCGSSFDAQSMTAYLVFSHDSFLPIQDGESVPELRVSWKVEDANHRAPDR